MGNKFKRSGRSHLFLRGFSIQQRLPLLICILLLITMTTFGLVSYIGVKKNALQIGRDRLLSLSNQLGSMMSQSSQNQINTIRNTANHPSIKKLLKDQQGSPAEAMEILQKIQQDTSAAFIDLVDKSGRLVLRSWKSNKGYRVKFDSLLTVKQLADTGKIGRIFRVRDSIFYSVTAGVVDSGQLQGYLVRWRMLMNNPRGVEQFSKLVGTEARIYFGNADNSLWTDMMKPVANPLPQDARVDSLKLFEFKRSDGKMMAVANPIKNSPWIIVVEFSKNTVLLSANKFLSWLIIAGTILVTIGIFIAWLMSRNIIRPLNKLTAATSAIASGNYSPTVPVDRRDEVGKLARAFKAMAMQVNRAKMDLEQKVIETGQMNEQLRNLSAHLQNIREDERKHIAREMHDELGQFLTALKMDLLWINKRLTSDQETPANREKLTEMTKHVDEAVLFVRKLAAELRPSILDDLGLIPALEWHSQEFSRRFQIDVEFKSRLSDFDTTPLVATGIFRIFQESLTNVARHAEAKRVVALLEIAEGEIRLSVTDDGKGFDNTNPSRKTLGLLGMKERALMLGGNLDIISEQGKGTTVLISVPLEQKTLDTTPITSSLS